MTDRAKGNLHDWVRTGVTVLALIWAAAMLVANVRQHSADIVKLNTDIASLNTVTLRLSQTVTDLAMNDAATKTELIAVRRDLERIDRRTERTP